MKFPVRVCFCALLVPLLLGLASCRPIGQTPGDEEKEPHFITGKSRASARDFKGAIAAFEKALENNPASAAAHFELAWIFDQEQRDAAAAIYHYERYLQLKPKAWNAEVVRERILSAKQDLAKNLFLGPLTAQQQLQIEKLLEERKRLQEEARLLAEENMRLKLQLANQDATGSPAPNTQVSGRSAAASRGGQGSAETGHASTAASPSRPRETRYTPVARSETRYTSSPVAGRYSSSPPTSVRRTHVVQAGETMASLSRRYGVSLTAMRAANPGVEPRKLRPGNVLNVP
jgi:tetratricopeptide (TPR) repeat protein